MSLKFKPSHFEGLGITVAMARVSAASCAQAVHDKWASEQKRVYAYVKPITESPTWWKVSELSAHPETYTHTARVFDSALIDPSSMPKDACFHQPDIKSIADGVGVISYPLKCVKCGVLLKDIYTEWRPHES